MATGTNGIATQLDANTLHINATGAANGPYTDSTQMNRCITYSSAISAGFKVNNADRYTSNTNRLVRYSDLAPGINTFRFRFAIDSIDDDARNIGISFNCTLYTSTGEAIGDCVIPERIFKLPINETDLPSDDNSPEGLTYYYIDLWTGTSVPYYVYPWTEIFGYNVVDFGSGDYYDCIWSIENTPYDESSPSFPDYTYNTLQYNSNIYTINYILSISH